MVALTGQRYGVCWLVFGNKIGHAGVACGVYMIMMAWTADVFPIGTRREWVLTGVANSAIQMRRMGVQTWVHMLFRSVLGVGALVIGFCAHAHLMEAQRGTLTIVRDGAYMVLSIPVSAFKNMDDDGDGFLSLSERNTHLQEIEAQIRSGVQLTTAQGVLVLEDLIVQSALQADAPTAPTPQLLVLGRFPLATDSTAVKFKWNLYGRKADERQQYITVSRGPETQLLILTPEQPEKEVLPSLAMVFIQQIQSGAEHILSGADHLLFLLVVLAAERSLRPIIVALTCFTFGHAMTLIACGWFAWVAPALLVEPTIAATIVAMAWVDLQALKSQAPHRMRKRLALVFMCAMVHGLGLADAFTDLGLRSSGKVVSLAGFNLGIELGQLAVALLAMAMFQVIYQWAGDQSLQRVKRWILWLAVALGTFWFFQRALVMSWLS